MIRYFFRALMVMGLCNLSSFHYVTPNLIPYVNEVQTVMETYCHNSIYKYASSVIDFDDLKDDEIGVCGFGRNAFTIDIDRKFWNVSTENERFQLMMHEAVHCYLHQEHIDKKDHFMYPFFTTLPKEKVIKQLQEICK